MSITEESRNDLYEGLTEALGKQRATTLMEHLPPRGWADVATKQDLQLLRTELTAEMDVRFAEVRAQFAEVGAQFAEVHAQFAEVGVGFAKVDVRFAELRTELHKTLRVHMFAMMAVMLTALGIVTNLVR